MCYTSSAPPPPPPPTHTRHHPHTPAVRQCTRNAPQHAQRQRHLSCAAQALPLQKKKVTGQAWWVRPCAVPRRSAFGDGIFATRGRSGCEQSNVSSGTSPALFLECVMFLMVSGAVGVSVRAMLLCLSVCLFFHLFQQRVSYSVRIITCLTEHLRKILLFHDAGKIGTAPAQATLSPLLVVSEPTGVFWW